MLDSTVIFSGNESLQGKSYSIQSIIDLLIFGFICYGIFIFSKHNRNQAYRIPTPNERLTEE